MSDINNCIERNKDLLKARSLFHVAIKPHGYKLASYRCD